MTEAAIETDRLILREWRDADRDPFAAMNADAEVMRYFPSLMTREQSDAMADRIVAHFDGHGLGLFAVERKDTGAFIGFTGFSICRETLPIAGDIEIGWRLARENWRRGYAYEAACACIEWFWQNLDRRRLVSFTAESNAPSRALMRKLGLSHRPELDFDYPGIPADNALRKQVVYVIKRENGRG